MTIVLLIDRRKQRAVASARAFAPRVQTVWIDRGGKGKQLELQPDGTLESRDLPEKAREEALLTVSHSGDSRDADVLFTTAFTPDVVEQGGVWIWRSVTEVSPITPSEASQMVEWAERGLPHEIESDLPPVLRRGVGMLTLTAIAVVCQGMLSDKVGNARGRDWWRRILGTKEDCLESMTKEWGVGLEREGAREKVREFVETIFNVDRNRLRREQIESCLEALARRLHDR